MGRYIALRVVLIVPAALAASLLVFAAMRILPGDVALTILSGTQHTEAMRRALREELGLTDPLPVQYVRWLASMMRGDLGGVSLETREPIRDIVARQLPASTGLAGYALFLSFLVSVPLGTAAAVRKGRWPDYLARIVSLGGLALPNVWLALIVLLLLLKLFSWSPPIIYSGLFEAPGEHLALVVWPALLLAWEYGSHLTRVMRSTLIEILDADYITCARGRGVPQISILFRHSLRAAMLPVATVAGMQLGTLIGGALVVETIFGIPGIGRGLVQAALARDYPLVQSVVTLLVVIYLVLNLLVDVLYMTIDPRIRFRSASDGATDAH